MKLLVAIFLTVGMMQCHVVCIEGYFPAPCQEEAIVKDLTGLDGCGIVLELNDGTRLVPERRIYVQAPKIEEDPLYNFDLKAGDRVSIAYQVLSESMNSCMAGRIVFITCISSSTKTTGEQ